MENTGKIRIVIEFDQADGQKVSQELSIDMLDSELKSIDSCEQKLLTVSYDAMRLALGNHFSELSKKTEIENDQPKNTE